MKISYNWLKEYFSKLPNPEKLAELLTAHSFEVQNIEKNSNDFILDIDILPNRAHDCLSYIGIARECAVVTRIKMRIKSELNANKFEDKKLKIDNFIKIENQDKEGCLRYVSRVINGIKIGPSPKWLKEKLESVGQKSINNVVDATNYIMLETGQPLHAFDLDKVKGNKIIVRKAKKNEKIITLDNEEIKLDNDVLVIADKESPLALAGIKGGKKAEITSQTKTIVLESANFDYALIRNASKKIGLRTEASIRFEYGLDPNLASEAMDRVAVLIQEIAGGKIVKGTVDLYSKKVYPVKINFDIKKAELLIGMTLSRQDVMNKFKSLGMEVDKSMKVTVPTIRQDLKTQEDLTEEVSRLIGYNKIESKAPLGLINVAKHNEILTIINKVKTIFEGAGFNEVYNFSFIGEDDLNKLKIDAKQYIELENPLSNDLKYLRRDLVTNILKNIKENYKQFFGGNDLIKIFELGKVYREKEEQMLTGAIVRQTEKISGENFYELKGTLDNLFVKLGIADYWYDDFKATPEDTDGIFWNNKATAEVKIGDKEIGFIGEINVDILNNYNIKRKVAIFNLNFDQLLEMVEEELIYQPPSPYPAAIRDIAVLINKEDRVGDVVKAIDDAGGELVQDVDLFDMYEGEKIPGGKKNLAFHIIFQSYEKTLKDEEVDKIFRKIIKNLEENNNWKVRR